MSNQAHDFLDYHPVSTDDLENGARQFWLKFTLVNIFATFFGFVIPIATLTNDISINLIGFEIGGFGIIANIITINFICQLICNLKLLKGFKNRFKIPPGSEKFHLKEVELIEILVIKNLCDQDTQFLNKINEILKFRGNKILKIDFEALTKNLNIEELKEEISGKAITKQICEILWNAAPCPHFETSMFYAGTAHCFRCNAIVNTKREIVGEQKKSPGIT